ncbi:MAG: ABC transporter permease [Deltaproteobacteria bacterium]|jgi:NitT/TauT family transport system permease protein|nr:ABC transporter permease [Deltaproteobacteria bacterium]
MNYLSRQSNQAADFQSPAAASNQPPSEAREPILETPEKGLAPVECSNGRPETASKASPIPKAEGPIEPGQTRADWSPHWLTHWWPKLIEARLSLLSLIVFFILWEGVCYFGIIGPYQLVPPSKVIKIFILKLTEVNPDGAYLWAHALSSLGLAVLGFMAAALVGIPLGLLMGWYPRFNYIARPLFDIIRPVPPIAWIPLAILWLGIGVKAKAFIIFLASFVPCVINSFTGIRLTNPTLTRVAKIHGASDFTVFLKIGTPSAIPMIFTGLRLSLNAAWTTLVAAELLAASQGLGFMIQMGRRLARPDIVIVGMLTIGFLGAILSWGLTKAEKLFVSSRRLS